MMDPALTLPQLTTVCHEVLSLVLSIFNIYMPPLGQVICHHGLNFHCNADDSQLYLSTLLSAQLCPQFLINCLHEIKSWMTTNLLQVSVDDISTFLSTDVLQPWWTQHLIDSSFHLSDIKSVTKSAFFLLRNIFRLRPSL